jgi:hypothetical protein
MFALDRAIQYNGRSDKWKEVNSVDYEMLLADFLWSQIRRFHEICACVPREQAELVIDER